MLFCEAEPYRNANTEDVHPVFRGRSHVHLMGTCERELIEYARRIGLRDTWIQRDRAGVAHYDATGRYMWAILNDEKVEKLDRAAFVAQYKAVKADRVYEREHPNATRPRRRGQDEPARDRIRA